MGKAFAGDSVHIVEPAWVASIVMSKSPSRRLRNRRPALRAHWAVPA